MRTFTYEPLLRTIYSFRRTTVIQAASGLYLYEYERVGRSLPAYQIYFSAMRCSIVSIKHLKSVSS